MGLHPGKRILCFGPAIVEIIHGRTRRIVEDIRAPSATVDKNDGVTQGGRADSGECCRDGGP